MKKVLSVFIISMAFILLTGCKKEVEVSITMAERNALRALQLTEQLETDYMTDGVLLQYFPATDQGEQVSSVWHYTGMISLSNRLLKLDKDNETLQALNQELFDGLEYYLENRSDDYIVYAVNRGITKGKALINDVYDDQEWLAREFLQAYENTQEIYYLDRAKELIEYILSGWDSSINPDTGLEWGGIYWGPTYTSKHTCSNAPVVSPLVKLYEITGDQSYLDWAIKIYDFSYNTFRMDNGIYGDLIGTTIVGGTTTKHGDLDTTAYSYNTGAMISAGADLYRVTEDQRYLDEALVSANAAYEYFGNQNVVDGYSQYPVSSTTWFNLVLLLGFVDLYPYAKDEMLPLVESFQESIDYAYDNYYSDGYLPVNWLKGWIYGFDKDENRNILDQSSHAETYALLADFELNIK